MADGNNNNNNNIPQYIPNVDMNKNLKLIKWTKYTHEQAQSDHLLQATGCGIESLYTGENLPARLQDETDDEYHLRNINLFRMDSLFLSRLLATMDSDTQAEFKCYMSTELNVEYKTNIKMLHCQYIPRYQNAVFEEIKHEMTTYSIQRIS